MERLTGAALLQYADDNKHRPTNEVIEGAGYYKERSGQISLNRTEFFKTMLEAKGVQVGSEPLPEPKRRQNVLKASSRGVVPISGLYTSKIGVVGGDYVQVSHSVSPSGRDQLILELADEPDQAPASICGI